MRPFMARKDETEIAGEVHDPVLGSAGGGSPVPVQSVLSGRRLLLIEDDYIIAHHLQAVLEEAGAVVIGPAPDEKRALKLLREAEAVDCAILDIDLSGRSALPLADALIARGVPFVFVTGHQVDVLPPPYCDAPLCLKPVSLGDLERALG